MTLLTICQDAIEEIGEYEKPSTIVGNQNATARRLLALANREGQALSKRASWQCLLKEHTITTTASDDTEALPSDYRSFVNLTWWDQTNFWKLFGPATPVQWQELKSGIITEGVRRWIRLQGDQINIHPVPPSSGETLSVWYISDQWCQSSGGAGQVKWLADTDVAKVDENLFTLGVKWRFLNRNGLPYEEEFNEYEREVDKAVARDTGAPSVRLDESARIRDGFVNIQEGSFG